MAHERLVALAERLEREYEIVPGLGVRVALTKVSPEPYQRAIGGPLPISFGTFIQDTGVVQAVDVASGLLFLSPEEIAGHLRQDYSPNLTSVEGRTCFPFAVNGAGEFLLLSIDDGQVFRRNAYTTLDPPVLLAASFEEFLSNISDDWERVLDHDMGAYNAT